MLTKFLVSLPLQIYKTFMRIVLSIILLFCSVTLNGQNRGATSSNIQPHRSYGVTPAPSAESALESHSVASRYALPVEEWQAEGNALRASFESPFAWVGRESLILIEGATAPFRLLIDGVEVGVAQSPSSPSMFNVSDYLKQRDSSSIEILFDVESSVSDIESWSSSKKEVGRVVMLSHPTMYVRDVELSTTLKSGVLNASIAIIVKSEALNARTSRINYELLSPTGEVVQRGNSDVSLSMRGEDSIRLFVPLPISQAWSAENPALYRLNISTQYRGRQLEYQSYQLGLRSLEVDPQGELLVNGVSTPLKALKVAADIDPAKLAGIKAEGYNTIVIGAGRFSPALYSAADSVGLYVVATVPINSSKGGDNILRGGNPTNDPEREGQYIERTDAQYNLCKLHPSVVAFALAEESLNGINLYESYLYLKSREQQRPIIYEGAEGQWNNDKLKIVF